jgi:radical SAM protein with 4Fe4S-binding SPASM domain
MSVREKGFMTVGECKAILNKIKGYTNYVYLHVKGEPLLHPHLAEILDLCQDQQMRVVIVTNGTLLEKNGALLLSKPSVKQINISLHCFSELPGVEERTKYIHSVLNFTKRALLESKIVISLRFWNADKIFVKEDNRVLYNAIEHEFAHELDIAQSLKPEDGLKLHERLWLNSDYEFQWPNPDMPELSPHGTCLGLRDQIAILRDGTVVPCCLDSEGVISLGNIHVSTFEEILNSQRSQNIINGFLKSQRVESLCRRCGFY